MSASAVLRLQKVGFTAEQVEALADFMDTQAASKADLAEAEHRLDSRLAAMDAKIDKVESGLKADIAALDAKIDKVEGGLKADIAALDAKIDKVEGGLKADVVRVEARLDTMEERITLKLTIRVGAMLFAAVGVIQAAMGLFVRLIGHG